MTLEEYKALFAKINKQDVFELHQPFIEELIYVKHCLDLVRDAIGESCVKTNIYGVSRCSELMPEMLKLQNQYQNMTLALNKLIGKTVEEDDDPMEKWINEYNRSHE